MVRAGRTAIFGVIYVHFECKCPLYSEPSWFKCYFKIEISAFENCLDKPPKLLTPSPPCLIFFQMLRRTALLACLYRALGGVCVLAQGINGCQVGIKNKIPATSFKRESAALKRFCEAFGRFFGRVFLMGKQSCMTVVSGVATSQGQEFDSSNRRIRTREFPSFGACLVPPSLKQTWHLKITHWKRKFLLETIIFRGYVSFRECNIDRPFRKWFVHRQISGYKKRSHYSQKLPFVQPSLEAPTTLI